MKPYAIITIELYKAGIHAYCDLPIPQHTKPLS